MPRIPFAIQSYRIDSLPASAQRLVNLYAEKLPPHSRSDTLVTHTPGLVTFATAGASMIRAMVECYPNLLVVTGGFPNFQVWSVTPAGVATLLGAIIGGLSEQITVAASTTQAAICVPPLGFSVIGGVLAQIVDPDFPADVSSVTFCNGYFVWSITNSQQYCISAVLDVTAYDPLDFSSAESSPDNLIRVMTLNNELWLFGRETIEVHLNTGAVAFPFEKQPGGTIMAGLSTIQAVAFMDNSFFWLGNDLIVYRSEGYRQKRVSTHALEKEWQSWVRSDNVKAFATQYGGHLFFTITFPNTVNFSAGPGKTYVYDVATDLWHERDSAVGGDHIWEVECAAEFAHSIVLGGRNNGKIYKYDGTTALENGASVTATATLPPLWADTGLGIIHRIELEMEPGANASTLNVSLDWSDDGGFTYNTPIARSMGASGARTTRVFWTRLGRFRERILRFTFAAGSKLHLYGADVRGDIAKGG